jgi:hypothetical protein
MRSPLVTGSHSLQIQDSENNTILMLLADAKPFITSSQRLDSDERDVMDAALRMAMLYYERHNTLDWANSQGRTALHVAALKGNEELVRVRQSCSSAYPMDLREYRHFVISEQTATFRTIKEILHYTS